MKTASKKELISIIQDFLNLYELGLNYSPSEWAKTANRAQELLNKKDQTIYVIPKEILNNSDDSNSIVLSKSENYQRIYNEVMEAYIDSHDVSGLSDNEVYKRRNLHYYAPHALNRSEVIAIMTDAVPSYNIFEPRLLLALPEDSQIFIAREFSVCIYVLGEMDKKLQKKMEADEFDYYDVNDNVFMTGKNKIKQTRIWWD